MARRSFREILRKGRGYLHDHMKVAALYIAFDGATPLPVYIRDFTKYEDTGDMGKRNKGYATFAQVTPRIIFFRSTLENARHGSIFSIAPGEAYRVERTDPPNDITRTADVTPLSTAEAEGLPVPDDDTVFSATPASYGYVVPANTGHGIYNNGAADQAIVADTPTLLVNDAQAFTDESQLPADLDTYYDGTHIVGRSGDGMLIKVSLTFTPSDETASDLTLWLDIGGVFTRIFEESHEIAYGAGEPHRIILDMIAYNRDTWEANRGRIWVESDGDGLISEVAYQIHRIHKGVTDA